MAGASSTGAAGYLGMVSKNPMRWPQPSAAAGTILSLEDNGRGQPCAMIQINRARPTARPGRRRCRPAAAWRAIPQGHGAPSPRGRFALAGDLP